MNYKLMGELPENAAKALQELAQDLNILKNDTLKNIAIIAHHGRHLQVEYINSEIHITWAKPVQFYRALSLLPKHLPDGFSVKEEPCFETLGMMFDASRGAVPTIDNMCFYIRKMALMGFNLGMMYTEDTFEIPSRPYFGYQRGRYTGAELRRLDDYANMFGIELCPCIQTLAHLERALHWPAMQHLKDNAEVLLVDSEQVYEFIDEMIAAAHAPYRSKRIHIGMDEAHGIGLGKHLKLHGYESSHDIIHRHLEKVLQITSKYDLNPMMWSDMFFREDSPTEDYYEDTDPSAKAISAVLPGVDLVYWDYYHTKEEEYARQIGRHAKLNAPTVFAGGIWLWSGPAPNYQQTIDASVAGLSASKNAGIPLVLATAWGDNGAESNLQTALLGMQLYAEYNYKGLYDEKQLEERFNHCCHSRIAAFLNLTQFNVLPNMRLSTISPSTPINASKFLLYQDPLVQLFADDMKGIAMAAHYAELERKYASYAAENMHFCLLFTFYEKLAAAMALKCTWHENASKAVVENNRVLALQLVQTAKQTVQALQNLSECWCKLWFSTNKPQGFEIIDARLGALIARMNTAAKRMLSFAENGEVIPELMEKALPYARLEDGSYYFKGKMQQIVSACKIDTWAF